MAKERKGGLFLTFLAFLTLAFSAGCAISSQSRVTQEDERLSLSVNTALGGEMGRQVECRAYHGVVALIGSVSSEERRQRAETLAWTVPGVVRINNLILVEEVADSSKAAGSAPVTGVPVIAARAEMVPAP